MALAPPPSQIDLFDRGKAQAIAVFWRWLHDLWRAVSSRKRGQVTLSSGTATVTFPKAEPDAAYYVSLAGDTAETFTWASKTTAGFTVNSSNGSSTAAVDWSIGRG